MSATHEPALRLRRWRRPERLGLRILLSLPIWLVVIFVGLGFSWATTDAIDRLSWDKTEGVVARNGQAERLFGGWSDVISVEYLDFTSPPGYLSFWDPTVTFEKSDLALGTKVTVYYDPDNTEFFTISGHASRFLLAGKWALLLVSLAVLLALLFGWKPLEAVSDGARTPRPLEDVVSAQSAVTRTANPSRTPVRSSATGGARQVFEEAVDRPVIDREIDIPNIAPAQAATLLRAAVRHVDTGGGLGIDVSYSSLGALSTIVPSAVEYLASGRLGGVVLLGVGAHHLSTVQQALISANGTANWCGEDELMLRAADEYKAEHAGDQSDDAAGE